jgi:hypothetical protein
MTIVLEQPPMLDEIAAAFPAARKPGTLFSWGDKLYNPSGIAISPALKAHEAVHGQRQGETDEDVRAWWKRYIGDSAFRFAEEVLAHRAEYRALCAWTKDRNARAQGMHFIATRLASPLYGGMVTYSEARRAVA